MSDAFPLPPASPEEARLDRRQLERLDALIARHVAEGRHPGAEIAIARHGRLVHCATSATTGASRLGLPAPRPSGSSSPTPRC